MARIAFILLCHKDPEGVIAQAQRLTATGDYVSIHFDGRAKAEDFAAIQGALAGNPGVAFAAKRHKCGWGAWSLVAATIEAVRAAVTAFPSATHFYMLSGDCMPIKTAEYAHQFLDDEDIDYIESVDFFGSDWIKTGFKEERLIYRHWFNERTQPKRFYASFNLQRRLGLTREVPADIEMKIGSQWWCLRRLTIEKVLEFCDTRTDVMRFFATTWIPDETFFQTIVRHVVPRQEISSRTLTYLIFTDYGMPVVFYNDHYDMLLGQNYLFARKISPEALELRERLGALWQETEVSLPTSDDGKSLFSFMTGRGRIGRRFGERFWESEGSLSRSNSILVIVAKKWHVAKRLTAAIRAQCGIPAVDYLFNEDEANLPDLGGVEKTVEKRQRHRRALLRLLCDEYEDPRLVLCLDPSQLDLISDIYADKAEARLLFIETKFDDDYVRGHIGRVGLAGASSAPGTLDRLVPTVRSELEHEAERLRDLELTQFYRISAGFEPERNAQAIADFLGVTLDQGRDLATLQDLFSD